MKRLPIDAGAARLLRLLAEALHDHVQDEDDAFERFTRDLHSGDFTGADLHTVIELLNQLADAPTTAIAPVAAPGHGTMRVPDFEERERFTTEAWGFLIRLRQSGTLDPVQFERVLDLLAGTGVRPVDEPLARAFAARVAFGHPEVVHQGGTEHGDNEVAH